MLRDPGLDALRDKERQNFREGLADFLGDQGFALVYNADFGPVINPLLEAFLNSGEDLNVGNFKRFLAEQKIFLEREIRPYTECDVHVFFSEVDSETRFLDEPPLDMDDLRDFQIFKFTRKGQSKPPCFRNYERFVWFLKALLLNREVQEITPSQAHRLQQGCEQYLSDFYRDDRFAPLRPNSTEVNHLEVFEFLEDFINYQANDETGVIDLRMSRSFQETLWFAEKMGIGGSEMSGFFQTSKAVALSKFYIDRERQEDEAKHQNVKDGTEKASFFEHFMAVTRLTLGAIDGLRKNSSILGSALLDQLKGRENYVLEATYTALLHDVIEDKAFTETQVMEFLKQAGLTGSLISQILENLRLLNAKRPEVAGDVEAYTQAIIDSENPVVLLVKYADILHNNKSTNKKKWQDGEDQVSAVWKQKQGAYAKIVDLVALQNPIHVRVQELVDILSVNPELVAEFTEWKTLLSTHPKKSVIIEHLPIKVREQVGNLVAV